MARPHTVVEALLGCVSGMAAERLHVIAPTALLLRGVICASEPDAESWRKREAVKKLSVHADERGGILREPLQAIPVRQGGSSSVSRRLGPLEGWRGRAPESSS
jgi:hypothetical protein